MRWGRVVVRERRRDLKERARLFYNFGGRRIRRLKGEGSFARIACVRACGCVRGGGGRAEGK